MKKLVDGPPAAGGWLLRLLLPFGGYYLASIRTLRGQVRSAIMEMQERSLWDLDTFQLGTHTLGATRSCLVRPV